MALKRAEYRVFEGEPDRQGNRWRFTLVARNGEPVAQGSEAYPSRSAAERAAGDAKKASRFARIRTR